MDEEEKEFENYEFAESFEEMDERITRENLEETSKNREASEFNESFFRRKLPESLEKRANIYCELYPNLGKIIGGLCGVGLASLFLQNVSSNYIGEHPYMAAAGFFGILSATFFGVWGIGRLSGKKDIEKLCRENPDFEEPLRDYFKKY